MERAHVGACPGPREHLLLRRHAVLGVPSAVQQRCDAVARLEVGHAGAAAHHDARDLEAHDQVMRRRVGLRVELAGPLCEVCAAHARICHADEHLAVADVRHGRLREGQSVRSAAWRVGDMSHRRRHCRYVWPLLGGRGRQPPPKHRQEPRARNSSWQAHGRSTEERHGVGARPTLPWALGAGGSRAPTQHRVGPSQRAGFTP